MGREGMAGGPLIYLFAANMGAPLITA